MNNNHLTCGNNIFLRRGQFLKTLGMSVCLIAGSSFCAVNAASLSSDAIEAVQQTITVKGQVLDSNGEPIIGANVLEKGTTNGTITDMDGNFTLNVRSNATLVVSYIGYTAQEVAVNNQRSLKKSYFV